MNVHTPEDEIERLAAEAAAYRADNPPPPQDDEITERTRRAKDRLREIVELPPLEYELQREALAKELGLRVSALDKLGHVDKWRSQRRMDVMSMKPRKLSAVLS